jgi:hypothetical protein
MVIFLLRTLHSGIDGPGWEFADKKAALPGDHLDHVAGGLAVKALPLLLLFLEADAPTGPERLEALHMVQQFS